MGKWREQRKDTWHLIWPSSTSLMAFCQSPDLMMPPRQCLIQHMEQLLIPSFLPLFIHLFSHSLVCCVIPRIHQIKSKCTQCPQDAETFHSHKGV